MGNVSKATRASSLSSGDLFAGYSQEFGDDVAFPLSVLMTYINANANNNRLTTQYASPSATGFSVSVASGDTHLILTPTAGFAEGTIDLPSVTDRQIVTVSCTQSVAALTVTGGYINGAPAALAANGFFTLKYDAVMGVWYRIG